MSAFEVEDILKTPKTGKAAGPGSIDNRLLKELARPLSFPLTDLFIFSLSKGKKPSLWKQANVTPIFNQNSAESGVAPAPGWGVGGTGATSTSAMGKVLV